MTAIFLSGYRDYSVALSVRSNDRLRDEIRGQLSNNPLSELEFPLAGDQDVAPVVTGVFGNGAVTYDAMSNLLSWGISYNGTNASVFGAHLYGPGDVGTNVGVQVNTGGIIGLGGSMVGSTAITDTQESGLLDGL